MSTYAFFYDKHGRNPCGDRSLIRIDGRLGHWRQHEIAGYFCRKRGFHAYTLETGHLRDIPQERIDNPPKVYYPVVKS